MEKSFDPYRYFRSNSDAPDAFEFPGEIMIDCIKQAEPFVKVAGDAGAESVRDQALLVMNIGMSTFQAPPDNGHVSREMVSRMFFLGVEAMRLAIMTGEPDTGSREKAMAWLEKAVLSEHLSRARTSRYGQRNQLLEAAWQHYKKAKYSTHEEAARQCANHYKDFEPDRPETNRIRTFRDYFAKRAKEEGVSTRRGRPTK